MAIPAELEEALKSSLQRCTAKAEPALSDDIVQTLRKELLTPSDRTHAKLLLASAEMVRLPKKAALLAAVSTEMILCFRRFSFEVPSTLLEDARGSVARGTLISFALSVFLELEPEVEATRLLAGLRRLTSVILPGSSGTVAALLIPNDLGGKPVETSETLALEIFAREFEASQRALLAPGISKDAKATARQRLNTAALSLNSAWGGPAHSLLRISENLAQRLDGEQDA